MGWERFGGTREAIAQLAAQIMYGEDVKEYLTAKRLAAKRVLRVNGARAVKVGPRDLPSNGEIKEALRDLVLEIEGATSVRRLFAMRICALEAMADLVPFSPRLIGSVATGHVREGSDVDLHVFAKDPDDVALHVRRLGWTFEVQHVSITKQGKPMEFTHVHVADVFPLELTVYAPCELKVRTRSSTDGKPIVRVRAATLRSLVAREHPEMWKRYEELGEVPSLEEILADGDDEDEPAIELPPAAEDWDEDLYEPYADAAT